MAKFSHSHVFCAPLKGLPVEFGICARSQKKTKMMGLPGRERSLTISSALWIDRVSDLGVVVDSRLRFADHIATIAPKGHQRANLIHRCFTSKDRNLFVKAFITYVRPILEYNSPVWSPTSERDYTDRDRTEEIH